MRCLVEAAAPTSAEPPAGTGELLLPTAHHSAAAGHGSLIGVIAAAVGVTVRQGCCWSHYKTELLLESLQDRAAVGVIARQSCCWSHCKTELLLESLQDRAAVSHWNTATVEVTGTQLLLKSLEHSCCSSHWNTAAVEVTGTQQLLKLLEHSSC